MKATLRALIRGEYGQDLVEYALLGALLSVVSIIALHGLGSIMKNEFVMVYLQLTHFSR
jgi:Flp pilus assembly pilin Flp